MGSTLIANGLVAGVLIVVVGLQIPQYLEPLNGIAVMLGAVAAVCALVAGVVLLVARGHVHDEHLDEEKARTTRMTLGILWAAAIAAAPMGGGMMYSLVHSNVFPIPVTAAVTGFYWLLTLPVALNGVAFFVARSQLNPNSAVPAEPA